MVPGDNDDGQPRMHEGIIADWLIGNDAGGTADFADLLQIKGVLAHAGLPEWETADYADWSRLGAGYRRQDCQNGFTTKDTKKLADWEIG